MKLHWSEAMALLDAFGVIVIAALIGAWILWTLSQQVTAWLLH